MNRSSGLAFASGASAWGNSLILSVDPVGYGVCKAERKKELTFFILRHEPEEKEAWQGAGQKKHLPHELRPVFYQPRCI